MKIKTEYWRKPIPTAIYDWSAIDEDTYDGAPDSYKQNKIGFGATEDAAIADLMALFEET